MTRKALFRLLGVGALALFLMIRTVSGATMTVVSTDGPGEGLNDPTPFTPVGGNNATTLGQARLNALQYAADIWAASLVSNIEIIIDTQFNQLACDANSALLGQAGPSFLVRDFPNADPATWYPIALANEVAGFDIAPGFPEIVATFNTLTTPTCFTEWYYGLDGNPPGGTTDLATVALHEFGHGLGFSTMVDIFTGQTSFDDVYMKNLETHGAGVFPDISETQRVAGITSGTDLHWIGSSALAEIPTLSGGVSGGHVKMYAPNPQEPGSSVSHFDLSLAPNQLMEPAYTGAIHELALSLNVMEDIGWTIATAGAGALGLDLVAFVHQQNVLIYDHFDDGVLSAAWTTAGSPGPEAGTTLQMDAGDVIFRGLATMQPEDTLAVASMDVSAFPVGSSVIVLLTGAGGAGDVLGIVLVPGTVALVIDENTGLIGGTLLAPSPTITPVVLITDTGILAVFIDGALAFAGLNSLGAPTGFGVFVR